VSVPCVKYYIAGYHRYCYRWPRNECVFGLGPPAPPSACPLARPAADVTHKRSMEDPKCHTFSTSTPQFSVSNR
jgi:hypothetical protein